MREAALGSDNGICDYVAVDEFLRFDGVGVQHVCFHAFSKFWSHMLLTSVAPPTVFTQTALLPVHGQLLEPKDDHHRQHK